MGISHDPTRPSLVASSEVAQIFSHLESSDATRIGLVVSFDDIHIMTMNVIMICLCGYIYISIYMWIYIHIYKYNISPYILKMCSVC